MNMTRMILCDGQFWYLGLLREPLRCGCNCYGLRHLLLAPCDCHLIDDDEIEFAFSHSQIPTSSHLARIQIERAADGRD